jgi:SAM-dependent methyltransferase
VEGVLSAFLHRVTGKRAKAFAKCEQLISGGVGLEVGGPSEIFGRAGILPIYPGIERLDNCNFAAETIWEGAIQEGTTFRYDADRAPGTQYVAEATDLRGIPSEAYDFILSSHVIEHTANPLRALSEWLRVLKSDGILLLVVPHKDGTFDHRRPVTSMDHLLEDFRRSTQEDDLTHLPEILELHDLDRDTAGSFEEFKRRSEQNPRNRGLHHHVFDTKLVVEIVLHLGLRIHAVECMLPYHIIAVVQKTPLGQAATKQDLAAVAAPYLRQSLFVSDKLSLKAT